MNVPGYWIGQESFGVGVWAPSRIHKMLPSGGGRFRLNGRVRNGIRKRRVKVKPSKIATDLKMDVVSAHLAENLTVDYSHKRWF